MGKWQSIILKLKKKHIFLINYYNFHTNYKHDLKYCTHTERN